MEVEDQLEVAAPRSVIIEEMQKPESLQQVIPNCESVEEVSEHEYIAQISERISMVSLDLEVDIHIEKFNPPNSFAVVVDGEAPGSNTAVSAEATYELKKAPAVAGDGGSVINPDPSGEEGTVITQSMDIEVSGKLASLGFRMLKSTVNKRIEQMGSNVEELFAEKQAQ